MPEPVARREGWSGAPARRRAGRLRGRRCRRARAGFPCRARLASAASGSTRRSDSESEGRRGARRRRPACGWSRRPCRAGPRAAGRFAVARRRGARWRKGASRRRHPACAMSRRGSQFPPAPRCRAGSGCGSSRRRADPGFIGAVDGDVFRGGVGEPGVERLEQPAQQRRRRLPSGKSRGALSNAMSDTRRSEKTAQCRGIDDRHWSRRCLVATEPVSGEHRRPSRNQDRERQRSIRHRPGSFRRLEEC